MKITVINGTEKKGVTFRLKKAFLDRFNDDAGITEFYLPRDCPNFCAGCTVSLSSRNASVPAGNRRQRI